MDDDRARALLEAERARVLDTLADTARAGKEDRAAEDAEAEVEYDDSAERLTAEDTDDALEAGLRDRLAALERAQKRLAEGKYGRSVRSGVPIPDDRLEADPAAELTASEAQEA